MDKKESNIKSFLNRDIKEFNLPLIITISVIFLALVGFISYKATTSYALFTDEINGTKTIAGYYEDNALYNSKSIVTKIKNEAKNIHDGVYFFDRTGKLDYGNGEKISINYTGEKPKGVVSIWNKTPIYVCTSFGSSNYEYRQDTKQVNTRALPCLTDRYQNLVINGDLSYEDNRNLTSFGTYNSGGYLSQTTSSRPSSYFSSDYIPIDPNKKYIMSVELKSSNTNSRYYAGIAEFDADKSLIASENVSYISNTLTELTQDLNTGDKTIHFNDLSNWNDTTSNYYQKGFIFWNYEDSTEYKYPELTYSKNKYVGTSAAPLYDNSAVDKTNNTITLTSNSGWSGPTIESGTKVSQSNSSGGGTYKYSIISYSAITTDWKTYSSTLTTGYTQNGADSYSTFKSQTKFIRFLMLDNYNSISNTTTYIKNISIREVQD